LNWIILALRGSSLLTLSPLLSYFWATARYFEDVVPALIMLGMIGFWQAYQFLTAKPAWRRFYTSIGLLLIASSKIISPLGHYL
jgi:hypothetical protein